MSPDPVTLSAEPTGPRAKAGPTGPGAGALLTEYALSSVLKRTPQQVMAQAANLWREVAWIRVAERVISGTVAGSPIAGGEGKVSWHLEDPDGETIDDEYKGEARALEAYNLLCKPQANTDAPQKLTRRNMWNLTSRHMGVCGASFWYKDQCDAYGIPRAYLYIRPDRLYPVIDDDGNLKCWALDADKTGKKPRRLEITDLVQFDLELPDEGFFGVGLVVSAINKIQFGQALDRHVTSVVASGGRLSGIISPKQGVIDNDNIYQQLVRDWRNIAEQPEAAKRAQVVRYPIEFTKTTADMQQLEVVKLLQNNRDELIELWGVPLSQIGGNSPAGLNSGDVRKYDRAALIQNAVEPRCDVIAEVMQAEMDLWAPYLGWAPKFVFDIPQFSDDSARHDLVAKDVFVPLKGWERRAQIGLDPLGPDVLDSQGRPIDDVVLVTNVMTEIGVGPMGGFGFGAPVAGSQSVATTAPDAAEEAVTASAPKVAAPAKPAPGTMPAKAKLDQAGYVTLVTADLAHQYPADMLDWVKLVTWDFDSGVKTKKIEPTKKAMVPAVVSAVATGMKLGADVDPIITVCLPSGEDIVANGNHRLAAAKQAGVKRLQAYIGTVSLANEAEVKTAIKAMQAPKFDDKGPGTKGPEEQGKADLRGAMRGFRARLSAEMLPRLQASAARVLDEQKRSVLADVRMHHAHVVSHPADTSVWWKPEHWDKTMLNALSGVYQAVGHGVSKQVNAHKADLSVQFGPAVPAPKVVAHVLALGAKDVSGINEWTRLRLKEIIAQGVTDGLSPAELGDSIEAWSGWNEYRAERIATTELAQAYNTASLGSYREAGLEMVQADDACTCDECQEAFGDSPIMSIDEADSIEDHPNGTLEWLPVVSETVEEGDE
jgi:hypothetical protein